MSEKYHFEDWAESQLKDIYESICNEYRSRLCESWGIHFDESWWQSDAVGTLLFLADWWHPLDMPELRYVVENDVPEKEWLEYCDFLESEINAGQKYPRISFHSWFVHGYRPKDLKDGKDL